MSPSSLNKFRIIKKTFFGPACNMTDHVRGQFGEPPMGDAAGYVLQQLCSSLVSSFSGGSPREKKKVCASTLIFFSSGDISSITSTSAVAPTHPHMILP